MNSEGKLARILVVEDVAILALALAQTLEAAGFEVLGPAPSAAKALALIAGGLCDGAVLDINLRGETSEPVATELISRGTPFIALTGYSPGQRPSIFANIPTLTKPVRAADLIAAVRGFLAGT